MRVLLLLPPMTQVNTPYPATAFLTGFLRSRGIACAQADLAIELVLALFSRAGLERVQAAIAPDASPATTHFTDHADHFLATIDAAVRFLQGRDPTLAHRIAGRQFLPEGPRFDAIAQLGGDEGLDAAFGALGLQDRAKYLATLFLADLADAIRDGIDPHFELSRYAEKLALSAPAFDALHAALQRPPTLVDEILAERTAAALARHEPDLVGITSPFPGNVYGAFRIAQAVRRLRPQARIAWGGGYPSTELRELREPRVFDYFDYVCLDAGEAPLLQLATGGPLTRTFTREQGAVVRHDDPRVAPIPHGGTGTPTYDSLPLDGYLSAFDLPNAMHRIWSDGRWNKLMVAHGCYWGQCTFCDTTLPYIERFSQAQAATLVDRMEALVAETGQTGFHLVDEAAPPAQLRALATEILRRGLAVTWWGNIRFEKTFTPELCALLAQSGCIAVSGGLEVANDRLLALIRKGVTVEQVARVTKAFADAGIMVHAYLMYGYPTQTVQETVDSLELVRQLFAAGCVQSAYWHRFALTCHSPIAAAPGAFGIALAPMPPAPFARNEIAYVDPVGADHDRLGEGLRAALYHYLHGGGLDRPVHRWFPMRAPRAAVRPDFIARALRVGAGKHGGKT